MAKELSNEQLEQVNGGGSWTLYDVTFTDSTKVSAILNTYPWLVNVESKLTLAANAGLTIGQCKAYGRWSDDDVTNMVNKAISMYNADGTQKQQEK